MYAGTALRDPATGSAPTPTSLSGRLRLMANDYRFTCPLPGGMHARPANALEHIARRFTCDISVVNGRTGQSANAKSVLGIVGLDIRHGDTCRVLAVGRDAAWAVQSLRVFVERTLPHVDDVAPVVESRAEPAELPPVLRDAGAVVTPGVAVTGGIGLGIAVAVEGFRVPDGIPREGADDADAEVRRVEEAFGRLLQRYDDRIAGGEGRVESEVLRAHRSVAHDPEFSQIVIHALRTGGQTAAGAIMQAESHLTGMLAATGSALLRERALDIRDVCRDLLAEVYGAELRERTRPLTRPSVCLADTLTPGQFLELDRRWLRGLVLAHGGTTSHTVILARSHGIPTIVGVDLLDAAALEGHEVVVDADLGVLVSALTATARRYYDMERRRLEQRRLRVQRFAEQPAATEDGRRIEVGANVGAAADIRDAVQSGAEGVGLFRTEMLFLARREAPSEDEQFDEYRRALAEADGRPVIVRTFDVGGDKPLPYLALPREDNPFLGYRAIRLYREFESLFRTQVRALLRASGLGPLRVMIPMVSSADEVRWVRAVIADEVDRLAAGGAAVNRHMAVGAMIEVPAAAFAMRELSDLLDFFSIGTNDLLQYFVAADRANLRVAALANPLEPPFLRLLGQVVGDAHARGRWVGLCGDLAGHARLLPLLVGLGLDELSMPAHAVPATKALLNGLSSNRCTALFDRACASTSAADVAIMLEDRSHWRPQPLLEPDLVAIDVDASSKAEAIKAGVDLMFAAGRTDRPRQLEQSVWEREATSPAGFGHGYAVLRCETEVVGAHTLAVVRLRGSVEWGAPGGAPVNTVLLLAIRPSAQASDHVRVAATLEQRLTHEAFRASLESAADAASVCAAINAALAPG
jgi:multiphosphoryl transfer protein